MPEETQTDINEVVEETPQGEEQPEALSTSEEPTEGELPEDAKERTKQEFEKLKQHNKQLAEENKKLKGQSQPIPSVLDYLGQMPTVDPQLVQKYTQPIQPQQPQPQPQAELLDDQGYLNADVLQKRLAAVEAAQRKAEEAERRAIEAQQKIARFEQDAEQRKLYAEYPELDPLNADVFNQEAYDLVRNELTSQIVQTGSRDALQAAKKMSKYFRQPQQPQAMPQAVQQRNQVIQGSGGQPRTVGKPISQMTTAERLAAWEARNNI